MRCLIVGDPHIQIQRLDDGKLFLNKIEKLGRDHDKIILLGDLFHTFSVIRSEVLSAWDRFFRQVGEKTVAIVGNHDYAGKAGGSHALEVFNGAATIIDKPTCIEGTYYLPFFRSDDEFIRHVKSIPSGSVLFCHQSFLGADYGNGFLAHDGVHVSHIKHLNSVISGHIHRRQAFANVWYPGVPFQHSFADAKCIPRVFTIDLKNTGYQIIEEHDLDMPRFIVIEDGIDSLLESLPEPDPKHSYKIVSKGTPPQIASFWKEDRAKQFRRGARRVVDAIIPERGKLPDEIFREYQTKREKLDAFIRSRKWRTSADTVSTAAGTLLTF